MNSSPDGPESVDGADAQCEAIIADYLAGVASGELASREALLQEHPHLAGELAEFFASHDQLADLGSWWRRAAQGPPTPAADPDVTLAVGPGGAAAAAALPELPDYQMLREIARGGMGVVYMARQKSLNRLVALKMILQGRLASAADRQRFLIEAAAAAKLKHPHIVVIHDVGEFAGQPYFTMEYVAGASLASLLRQGLMPAMQVARYVHQVARAVQCAHDHGVLHRDIKPSNVLIDEADQARVTDFGLAKQVDAGDQLTLSGQVLGTPSYMAPEQITGPPSAVGAACDIYAIGALLYEMIAGRPPFRGESSVETLMSALDSEPRLPRHYNPHAARDLEMIAMKCLEKNPRNRYDSAQAIADDLARFMEGDSISISSPNLLDRLTRTLERSQFDREFLTWSRMLMHVAWIALATHSSVFFYRQFGLPHVAWGVTAIRLLEIVVMTALMSALRKDWYPPRGAPARQLFAVWLGYMTGSTVLLAVGLRLTPPGAEFNEVLSYPAMAVLGSLAFVMLGSSYWGYCYVMGAAFVFLALAMTFWMEVAPLAFGLCWGASLATLGVRLGRLAHKR
jgi:serine/threonine protein kinase